MRKRISIKLSLVLIILSILISCDPADVKLTLVNDSQDTVYYCVELCEDSIKAFSVTFKDGKIDSLFSNILLKGESQSIPVMGTWEGTINDNCKDSMLRVFFFSKRLIKNTSVDSIMKYQIFSKRVKLKVIELDKLNWRVSYP